jgi:ubiquinone/menaquinone biosynthesis C-methylase UbiE
MSTTWEEAASAGLDGTGSSAAGEHFDACRDGYLEQLHAVGVRPGWHVLDASGGGAFLPALAELVGPRGRVSAADIRRGGVPRLPYEDETFDAVWCAGTVRHLDDGDLALAISELCRVVCDGGLVAIMDLDGALVTARPGDPFLFTDYFRLAAPKQEYARHLLRTRELYRWLEGAGLTAVRQRTVLVEHRAPFSTAAQRFYRTACADLADRAIRLGAPGDWHALLDPGRPGHPFDDPHAYLSEGNVLAVGVVDRTAR